MDEERRKKNQKKVLHFSRGHRPVEHTFFVQEDHRTSKGLGSERVSKTSRVRFSTFEEGFCAKRRRRRRRRKRAGFVREFFFSCFQRRAKGVTLFLFPKRRRARDAFNSSSPSKRVIRDTRRHIERGSVKVKC